MRIIVLTGLLLAPLAFASHTPLGRCDSGNYALGILEVGAGDPSATFYVDDRNLLIGNGVWLYEETNGIYSGFGDVAHNVQRGGASPFVTEIEICVDDPNVEPDLFIF